MSEQRDLTATLVPVLTDDASQISSFQSDVAEAFRGALSADDMSATLSLGVDFNEASVDAFIRRFTDSVNSASSEFIQSIEAEMKSLVESMAALLPPAEEESAEKKEEQGIVVTLTTIADSAKQASEALKGAADSLETISYTFSDGSTETISTVTEYDMQYSSQLGNFMDLAVETAAVTTTKLEDQLKKRIDVNVYFPEETVRYLNETNEKVVSATASIGNATGGQTGEPRKKDEKSKEEEFLDKADKLFSNKLGGLGNIFAGWASDLGGYFKAKREEQKAAANGDEKAQKKAQFAKLQSLVDIGFKGMLNAFNFGLDMFEKLWKMIQDASPMLQNILGLFNTAISLILMPIGNKIAELLIPSILDIMDSIQDIWDEMDEAFEKDGLGGMISVAVKYCLEIFFDKLEALISVLMNSNTSWLRSLGLLLGAIETIMKGAFMTIFTTVIDLTAKLLSNLKYVITAFGALLGAHLALSVAQATADGVRWGLLFEALSVMGLIIASTSLNPLAAAAVAGTVGIAAMGVTAGATGMAVAAAGALAGGATAYLGASALGLAEGGYVPATEGGELHILAEGGEGEYVVPESKVGQFVDEHAGESKTPVKGDTYNIVINGYTDSELKSYITDVVDEKTSRARIRAGI